MKQKNSIVWLIIILCIIILGLSQLISSSKHKQQVDSLNNEINRLNKEIESVLSLPLSSPLSEPVSTPSSSLELEFKAATDSKKNE